ncbi:MAG TPA: hypothetical protein VK435_03585, partial [Thermodesulfovibrionales bacterium]|nr:hypothetical protein [Thermodesulfovibrionales bacterium]
DLLQEGILCRGGLAYGKHFSKEGFLFSNALIDAYNLERQVAKYPRIVVSRDLMDDIYPEKVLPPDLALIKEYDGEYFIDYLSATDSVTAFSLVNETSKIYSISPVSLREKQIWLIEYYNHKFPSNKISGLDRFS